MAAWREGGSCVRSYGRGALSQALENQYGVFREKGKSIEGKRNNTEKIKGLDLHLNLTEGTPSVASINRTRSRNDAVGEDAKIQVNRTQIRKDLKLRACSVDNGGSIFRGKVT